MCGYDCGVIKIGQTINGSSTIARDNRIHIFSISMPLFPLLCMLIVVCVSVCATCVASLTVNTREYKKKRK